MVAAYGILPANQGVYTKPQFFIENQKTKGSGIYEPIPRFYDVLNEDVPLHC
jgi:hypothetical protein